MRKDIVIYCDGFGKFKDYEQGCSVALVIDNVVVNKYVYLYKNHKEVHHLTKAMSYNVLEYFALWNALKLAIKFAKKNQVVEIYSDSQIIVFQMNGMYSVRGALYKWNLECTQLREKYKSFIKIIWIKRNKIVSVLGH